MKINRIFSLAISILMLLASVSCSKSKTNDGGGGTPPPGGGGSSISISSMSFPATTTVKKGTTVKWTNNDAMAHTVTSDDGSSFSSGNIASGASYSYTANTKGTFPYHCEYHQGMKGSLIVTD